MHSFSTHEVIMTISSIIGWTIAIMQFSFYKILKNAIITAITEHKLDCMKEKLNENQRVGKVQA